jgi:hypothetical protein
MKMLAHRAALGLLAAALVAACSPDTPTSDRSGSPGPVQQPNARIAVTAVAGPTCPVEREDDPDCDPRPVEGAMILVQPADGRDIAVATGTTDADGRVTLEVPPGDYIVVAGEVEGLLGPEASSATVGEHEQVEVTLAFDTGIR